MKNEYIKNTTKKNQRIARGAAQCAYENRRWTYLDLYHAYDRPSHAKEQAWRYCKDLRDKLGGWDLLISSRNTFQFSACFKFLDDDGKLCYAYITRDYDRYCRADDEQEVA